MTAKYSRVCQFSQCIGGLHSSTFVMIIAIVPLTTLLVYILTHTKFSCTTKDRPSALLWSVAERLQGWARSVFIVWLQQQHQEKYSHEQEQDQVP